MKILIAFLLGFALVVQCSETNAQATLDTIQARKFVLLADKYAKELSLDSSAIYYRKAAHIYKSIATTKKDTLMVSKYLECLCSISAIFSQESKFVDSKNTLDSALTISLKNFGNEHLQTARVYHYYGTLYYYESKYDESLEFLFKEAEIYRRNLTMDIYTIADNNFWIGADYIEKGEPDKAIEFTSKCIEILKENPGKDKLMLANAYDQMAKLCYTTSQYDKSLEYLLNICAIYKESNDEKGSVAKNYANIGVIYESLSEHDKALEYFFKSLETWTALIGEQDIRCASLYSNIGYTYIAKSDYDKALEYILKGFKIEKDALGEKNVKVGWDYISLGDIYMITEKYALALGYYHKSLEILTQFYGRKQPDMTVVYLKIARAYGTLSDYYESILFYQKGIGCSLPNFNDTINIYTIPQIKDDSYCDNLLAILRGKALILADTTKAIKTDDTLTRSDRLLIALKHYEACNMLIDMARKKMSKLSDKMGLGEIASQIYEEAVGVCLNLAASGRSADVSKYKELAFYFSEKGKSSVLLETLAGQEAQKFAGIPDPLLEAEQKLLADIAFYTKELAEPENLDSVKIDTYQQQLFGCNRSYDSLIVVYEKKFPKYHELKYSINTASVKDVQRLIDKRTAMVSYFVSDSTITAYTITKSSYSVFSVRKPENMEKSLGYFRNNLAKLNQKSSLAYKKTAYNLYEMLVPKNLDKNIENLIIVPDGVLATIPFETLLTTKVADTTQFQNLPYLVKKYSISYCSSATLFKETFAGKKGGPSEVRPLNDWIAYAPVFDDENSQGTSLASRALISELHKIDKDSTSTRGLMRGSGKFIPPLPGSESEVRSIFGEFDKENFKTKVELKENASESRIKSGELENYKYIHFATHGFVNSEKPELSGLLLAQVADSTNEQNDGILYSGEIYNLKLNADLVVLSACETGLGKIKKGEGIIGLTRALLYAGAKNLMVSLWQVSDQSTSDLMISFYKNLLNEKSARLTNQVRYAPLLQQAKLKMIGEAKFAHPFYWSPFILIGQ